MWRNAEAQIRMLGHEMDLNKVRKDINEIDDKMKALYGQRLECSTRVAAVKMNTGDVVFKPDREKEMCDRLADDPGYLCFIRNIIQISRKHQYQMFIDYDKCDKAFLDTINDSDKKVFDEGGTLSLKLKADSGSVKGLCVKDILAIVANSSLELEELEADSENVLIRLNVKDEEIEKKEAYVLSYMLYMETLH